MYMYIEAYIHTCKIYITFYLSQTSNALIIELVIGVNHNRPLFLWPVGPSLMIAFHGV